MNCSKNHGQMSSEFRPKSMPGVNGVYISRAIVSQDVNDDFLITIMNVNVEPVSLKKRQVVGRIDTSQEQVSQISLVKEVDKPTIGEHLNSKEP